MSFNFLGPGIIITIILASEKDMGNVVDFGCWPAKVHLILKFRLADHRGYINNQVVSKATGAHFNLPGHSLAHLKITILEQVKFNNEEYRREREKSIITS